MTDIFELSYRALSCGGFAHKKSLLADLKRMMDVDSFNTQSMRPPIDIPDAGRPVLPVLVHPTQVPRRRLGSTEGRIGLIHAIAHIEFNAINLALDAIYRFREMPCDYYRDWLRVASEEATHFELLVNRLHELNSNYGTLVAHGGLWEMSVVTAYDVTARMALVPRVLEARGLDVTPAMINKLRAHGDDRTVSILQRILREEIDHVRIGNRWFRYCCEQSAQDPVTLFSTLLRQHGRIALRGPFNREARLEAGFTNEELQELALLEAEFKRDFAKDQSKDEHKVVG